jgi:hypothetical protein
MAKIIIKDGEISSSAGINIPGSLSISGNLTIGDNFTDTLTVNSAATFNDDLTVIDTISGSIGNFSTVNVGTISATNFVGLPPSAGGATTPGGSDTQIQFNSGSSFSGSSNLNYNYTTNVLSGTVAQFNSITASYSAPRGTSSSLPYSFNGDSNTGIYSPGPDTISIVEGGTEAIRINSAGYVGINSTNPTTRLYVKGDTTISGALLIEGNNYIMGPGNEAGIYNFKYIRGENGLYLAGNSLSSGTVYLNQGGGFINFFQNTTGSVNINGNIFVGSNFLTPASKIEIGGTTPYITMEATTTPTTPSTSKAAYWANSTRKEPYFTNENGDSINMADGGGSTLMYMKGFSTANLTSTRTPTTNTTYAIYMGKNPEYLLSGDVVTVKFRVTTLASSITWAEVALATGNFVSGGPSLLTTRGFTSLSAVVNSTGIKSTNITTTANILPGADLWLLFGIQATTVGVYRAASIADDLQSGVQLSAASTRPSTMSAGTSFVVESATTLPIWMTLKI